MPGPHHTSLGESDDDDQNLKEKYLEVMNIKRSLTLSEMTQNLHNVDLAGHEVLITDFKNNLKGLALEVENMKFTEEPNYSLIKDYLRNCSSSLQDSVTSLREIKSSFISLTESDSRNILHHLSKIDSHYSWKSPSSV